MNETNTYIPGICNIGRAEIVKRKQAGWIGVIVTIAVWFILFVVRVQAAWQLLLFIPASLAVSGFLQAYMHFCAGFGSRGLFNFGPKAGKAETVMQAEFRAKDKKKSRQILGLSLIIGVAVAVVAYFVQSK
jgi:hypothetical protein